MTWHKTYRNISLSDEVSMIDGVAMKGKRIIIIPSQLQKQILSQLHSNHMGIENMRLLTYESIY